MPETVYTHCVFVRSSYENMGQANITCASGCECQPTLLEGHWTERSSQLKLIQFYVTQSETCVIRIEGACSEDTAARSTLPGNRAHTCRCCQHTTPALLQVLLYSWCSQPCVCVCHCLPI